ncbi:MAG: hypothetical protein HY549_02945 [Elusimicrobia bacterium]|nr:hypothetical protein [Elusimicrobiota bacterium]
MGLLTAAKTFGRIDDATGNRPAELRLQYGGGYGTEERSRRPVHTGRATFVWRLLDNLALRVEGLYMMTPFYTSRQASGGLSLSY